MPVIRYVPIDRTEQIIAGEQMRVSVSDIDISLVVQPMLMGAPLVNPQTDVLQDEDAFLPMESFSEVGMLSVRRQKNGVLQYRSNAGISTPCGAWISNDWSPLLLNTVGGYEQLWLTGVSRDSAGSPLGNCTVKIFRTFDDVKVAQTVSDGSGNWSRQISELGPFFYVEYLAGAPDRAGTSINTNVAAKVN